jgi:hypothetical protein
MQPNAYKNELGIRITSYDLEKHLLLKKKAKTNSLDIYHQQNNLIVQVKSFLVLHVVFFGIHFLDQQLLVDDVQLMDHNSNQIKTKEYFDKSKNIFVFLLDQYLEYFVEYQLMVHIVLIS